MFGTGRRLALALLALGCACPGPAPPAWQETLRVAVPFDLATLDPQAIDRLEHFALLGNLYEPLVANDPELRLRPALAVRWENPDATTWVFQLRPARFQDGRPLTSADVAWTIERLRRRNDLQIRSYVGDVVDVATPAPDRVVLRTASHSRTFLSRLTSVLILPTGTTDAELKERANGSGPYQVETWQAGRKLVLRRRPDGPAGLPRRVLIDLARSPELAMSGLQSGAYDLVRADLRDLATRLPAGRFTILQRENLFTKMLAFDHARERTPFCETARNPFRDVRVRRAVHLAIDRAALVRRLSRQASPNVQPVPRSVFGFDPGLAVPAADLPAARALLAQAGFPEGFACTLHTRAIHAADARLVAEALLPLGLRVRVAVPPDAEYFALLAAGGASFWLDRFGCTTGDSAEVMIDLMHTRDPGRGLGTLNFGGFSDADVDRVAEDIVSMPEDVARRRAALQQGMALILERLPVVSLFNDEDVYGMDARLSIQPRADSYLPLADLGLGARP
jgi:peptide/nickel transport system substrate-binding protein